MFILIEDAEGNQVRSKIDLGVHDQFELEQEEYCFDIVTEGILEFMGKIC